MAIIKKSEYKKMKAEDLDKRLIDLRKELMKANAQIKSGTVPENPGRVKAIKKTIANILRMQSETKEVTLKQ